MSKYDSLKFLKETKARVNRCCDRCGLSIEKGDIYYKENVGMINTIGLALRGFCVECYTKYGGKLLKKNI